MALLSVLQEVHPVDGDVDDHPIAVHQGIRQVVSLPAAGGVPALKIEAESLARQRVQRGAQAVVFHVVPDQFHVRSSCVVYAFT